MHTLHLDCVKLVHHKPVFPLKRFGMRTKNTYLAMEYVYRQQL